MVKIRPKNPNRYFRLPESHTAQLLIAAVATLGAIVGFGTLFFEMYEGLTFLDALYATMNTVTTVGRSMQDFSHAGKVVAMVVMVLGTAAATMVIALVTNAFVEGQIRRTFGRKRMEKHISRIANHVLICGYGRMGRIIAREMANVGVPFVVIEKHEAGYRQVTEEGLPGVHGDATSDEVLLRCGVDRARALISVTSSDADNDPNGFGARLWMQNRAQWRIRTQNRRAFWSHADFTAREKTPQAQGKMTPPQRKTAQPMGKTAPQMGKTAQPMGKMTPPRGKTAQPQGKTAPRRGKTALPQGREAQPRGKIAIQGPP